MGRQTNLIAPLGSHHALQHSSLNHFTSGVVTLAHLKQQRILAETSIDTLKQRGFLLLLDE